MSDPMHDEIHMIEVLKLTGAALAACPDIAVDVESGVIDLKTVAALASLNLDWHGEKKYLSDSRYIGSIAASLLDPSPQI